MVYSFVFIKEGHLKRDNNWSHHAVTYSKLLLVKRCSLVRAFRHARLPVENKLILDTPNTKEWHKYYCCKGEPKTISELSESISVHGYVTI